MLLHKIKLKNKQKPTHEREHYDRNPLKPEKDDL